MTLDDGMREVSSRANQVSGEPSVQPPWNRKYLAAVEEVLEIGRTELEVSEEHSSRQMSRSQVNIRN